MPQESEHFSGGKVFGAGWRRKWGSSSANSLTWLSFRRGLFLVRRSYGSRSLAVPFVITWRGIMIARAPPADGDTLMYFNVEFFFLLL